MFAGRDGAAVMAEATAHWFNDHHEHRSHGLRIGRDAARDHDVVVDDLEDDPELPDLVLTVFHITSISFYSGTVVKIIEDHLGRRFLKQIQVQQVPHPVPPPS